jgi:hypothetical protein
LDASLCLKSPWIHRSRSTIRKGNRISPKSFILFVWTKGPKLIHRSKRMSYRRLSTMEKVLLSKSKMVWIFKALHLLHQTKPCCECAQISQSTLTQNRVLWTEINKKLPIIFRAIKTIIRSRLG